MKVADLMQRDVRTIRPDDTLTEAVEMLADGHVTALPVVDALRRVIGVVSATDILEAEAEREGGVAVLKSTLVEDIMTPKPLLIAPTATVREAAQQMLYAEVHRLFVEENGALVGVISQTDIVRAVANGDPI